MNFQTLQKLLTEDSKTEKKEPSTYKTLGGKRVAKSNIPDLNDPANKIPPINSRKKQVLLTKFNKLKEIHNQRQALLNQAKKLEEEQRQLAKQGEADLNDLIHEVSVCGDLILDLDSVLLALAKVGYSPRVPYEQMVVGGEIEVRGKPEVIKPLKDRIRKTAQSITAAHIQKSSSLDENTALSLADTIVSSLLGAIDNDMREVQNKIMQLKEAERAQDIVFIEKPASESNIVTSAMVKVREWLKMTWNRLFQSIRTYLPKLKTANQENKDRIELLKSMVANSSTGEEK